MANLINAYKIAGEIQDDVPMTRRQWVASSLIEEPVTQHQEFIVNRIAWIVDHIKAHLTESRLLYDRKTFAAKVAPSLGIMSSVYFRCWEYDVDVETAVLELVDRHLVTDKAFRLVEDMLFGN